MSLRPDIIVMEFEFKLDFTSDVDQAYLPRNAIRYGLICETSGWGSTMEATYQQITNDPNKYTKYSDILKQAFVSIKKDNECEESYEAIGT